MKSSHGTRFRLDQSLHGYSDGHRLLATSAPHDREVKRLVLDLSDMSGRAMQSGFETYLTGYPIPSDNSYALARTWYAQESGRPGAVWTHTIFLGVDAVLELQHMSALLSLFVRPGSSSSVWRQYERPLEERLDDVSSPTSEFDLTLVDQLVLALYGSTRPVIVPQRAALPLETLVLACWDQQPPSLRSSFSFCTGALLPRTANGKDFDLQVVPKTTSKADLRRVRDCLILDGRADASPVVVGGNTWVREVSEDLVCGGGPFRRFLHSYAEGKDRRQVRALASIRRAGENPLSDVRSLVTEIAAQFPGEDEGLKVKSLVLAGDTLDIPVSYLPDRRATILQAIATLDTSAFDSPTLPLDQSARAMWQGNVNETVDLARFLLTSPHLTHAGERIVSSLVATASIEDILKLCKQEPALVTTIARVRPDLLVLPDVWRLNPEQQREVFAACATNVPERPQKTRIVQAMLDGSADAAAHDAISAWAGVTAAAVLGWFNSSSLSSPESLSSGWIEGLQNYAPELLKGLKEHSSLRQATFALVATCLLPNDHEVRRVGPRLWLQEKTAQPSQLSRPSLIRLRAFQLAVAFSSVTPGGDELIAHAFADMHSALELSTVPYSSWEMLEPYLPELSLFRNWDRCERLRQGTIALFAERSWRFEHLWRASGDLGTLELILRAGKKCPQAKLVSRWLASELKGSASRLEPRVRAAIDDVL